MCPVPSGIRPRSFRGPGGSSEETGVRGASWQGTSQVVRQEPGSGHWNVNQDRDRESGMAEGEKRQEVGETRDKLES